MVGRLLTAGILISVLAGCASTNDTYISQSVKSSANNSYQPNKSYINVVTNLFRWEMYKLPKEDQLRQEQAVFFALDNSEEGEVIEWYGENDSSGKVSVVMSYPQGGGYCRVLFSQINYKQKVRDFKETACRNGSTNWTFLRR